MSGRRLAVTALARARAVEALRCEADERFARATSIYITEDDETVDEHLVSEAMTAVWYVLGTSGHIDDDILEAAALLEDGWSPGDPVERITS